MSQAGGKKGGGKGPPKGDKNDDSNGTGKTGTLYDIKKLEKNEKLYHPKSTIILKLFCFPNRLLDFGKLAFVL